jgi:O-methyltransferase domain
VEISKRCREAMHPGGRVVIIEQVVVSHDDPGIGAALSDLNVLTLFQGGRERTLLQFDALLQAAGLLRVMVFRTYSPYGDRGCCGR